MATKVSADGTVLGTYRACRRCKGTGWWGGQVLRGCFACGGQNGRPGSGRALVETAAGVVARLEAHAAEVRAEVETEMTLLNEKIAADRPAWACRSYEARIVDGLENLARIEAEIVAVLA